MAHEEEEMMHLNDLRPRRTYGTCNGLRSMGTYNPLAVGWALHEVGAEETLIGIALKYNLKVEELRRTNNLWGANDTLWPGRILKVPLLLDHRLPDGSLEGYGPQVEADVIATTAWGPSSAASSSDRRPTSSPTTTSGRVDSKEGATTMTRSTTSESAEVPEQSLQDFLTRLDSSIDQHRKKMSSRSREATRGDGGHLEKYPS